MSTYTQTDVNGFARTDVEHSLAVHDGDRLATAVAGVTGTQRVPDWDVYRMACHFAEDTVARLAAAEGL